MDKEKLCFIVYSDDLGNGITNLQNFLLQAIIPDGLEIECIEAIGNQGMARAFNEAMLASDAKYKVYLRYDTKILYGNILYEIYTMFRKYEDVGIVGVFGTERIPTNALWNQAKKTVGILKNSESGDIIYGTVDFEKCVYDVMMVSGGLMATQYDIPWREDLFQGTYFCSAAQCIEFKKHGYRTVVLQQRVPYIAGILEDVYSNEEREAFLDEYSKDIYPLVSVGIPTFNRPEMLEEALRSAMNPTYRNLEIFVSDNGTNEETKNVVCRCMEEDKRVQYYHSDTAGEMKNWRNFFALFSERSEYIQLLCDDDILFPNKIGIMLQGYFDFENISLVTSWRKVILYKNGIKKELKTEPFFSTTAIIKGELMGRILLEHYVNIIGEPTTVLLKKDYLKNGFLGFSYTKENAMITDLPTWIHMMQKGDLLYIAEYLSCFRLHAGQAQVKLKELIRGK